MKLANNTVVVLNMMAFIEGVEIAVSSGIDWENFVEKIRPWVYRGTDAEELKIGESIRGKTKTAIAWIGSV